MYDFVYSLLLVSISRWWSVGLISLLLLRLGYLDHEKLEPKKRAQKRGTAFLHGDDDDDPGGAVAHFHFGLFLGPVFS